MDRSKVRAIEDIYNTAVIEDRPFTKHDTDSIVDIVRSMSQDDMDEYLMELEIEIRDDKIQSFCL